MMATTQNSKTKTTTFAERMDQRINDEDPWRQYNSDAVFHPGDIQKSLEILAEQTFSTDVVNRNAYQEAILKSLTETINPEIGVKDFWAKMAEANCKTLRIENGHLNFYDSRNKKIDLTAFTQPIVFEMHSSYYDQRVVERKQHIEEAQKQLQELLDEINKNRTK